VFLIALLWVDAFFLYFGVVFLNFPSYVLSLPLMTLPK
jgi:hypothetical protein